MLTPILLVLPLIAPATVPAVDDAFFPERTFHAYGVVVQRGDFDGNGHQNLVIAELYGAIGSRATGVAIIDVDADGMADAITLNASPTANCRLLVNRSPGALVLDGAAPSAPGLLFIAVAVSPTPPLAVLASQTSADGSSTLSWAHWPTGVSGQSVSFQWAIVDAGAPAGVALSNAVVGHVP
jgi:hypothetical protein